MKHRLTLLSLISGLVLMAQETTLNLASDVWPPFTNVTSEKSIALDIVSTALNRLKLKTNHEIVSFESVIEGLNANKFDGSAALWETAEREKTLLFSDSYLQNRLVLVGLKGMDVSLNSIAELTNRTLGLVEGYAYDDSLLNATNLELVFSKSDQINLEMLFDKKIDYMLVDELLIQYLLKYQLNDVNKYLAIGVQPFEIKTLHFALRKDIPNAETIISSFNNEIKIMLKDGTYNQVLNLDWVRADIDGDGVSELIFNGKSIGTEIPKSSYAVYYNSNDKNSETNFFVNGKSYSSWNDIPDNFKKKVSFQVSDDIYNPGLRIKFN